jgi:hypothetical protein
MNINIILTKINRILELEPIFPESINEFKKIENLMTDLIENNAIVLAVCIIIDEMVESILENAAGIATMQSINRLYSVTGEYGLANDAMKMGNLDARANWDYVQLHGSRVSIGRLLQIDEVNYNQFVKKPQTLALFQHKLTPFNTLSELCKHINIKESALLTLPLIIYNFSSRAI